MESFNNPGSSQTLARGAKSRRSPSEPSAITEIRATPALGATRSGRLIASSGVSKARRLVADQIYFGLEAGVFRAGAERALARMSHQSPERARLDTRTLGHDFQIDPAASGALLSALLSGGMLYPDGTGMYRPTRLFREYALASVVAPLSRERAKGLVDQACALAARINSEWDQVPFRIAMMAVSGGYMSRRDQLSDLTFSLALRPRHEARSQRPESMLSRDEALRMVLEALHALSSFIVVRIVADRKAVQRPFGIVFQANESAIDPSVGGWERFRDWSASVTRWLAVK